MRQLIITLEVFKIKYNIRHLSFKICVMNMSTEPTNNSNEEPKDSSGTTTSEVKAAVQETAASISHDGEASRDGSDVEVEEVEVGVAGEKSVKPKRKRSEYSMKINI